jgi:ABC-2 type transport system ATP-binding protein
MSQHDSAGDLSGFGKPDRSGSEPRDDLVTLQRPVRSAPVLEAAKLYMAYGSTVAVDGVGLTVNPGEAYGLVGPDGAGKTTTMRLLVGYLSAGSGDVRILGYDLRRHRSEALTYVGYLAQRFSLYEELTVQENIAFFGAARSLNAHDVKARSAELLKFVGLAGFERRMAGQLSGGMKQKLGLACALIHRPRLLLLDEPTTGVDPVTRQDFWQLIIRLLADGVAVVVSTPYMDEAARCKRLGFMSRGRILMQGGPRELAGLLAGRVLMLVAQPKAAAREVCRADPEIEDVAAFGDRLHLRLAAGAALNGPGGVSERLAASLKAAGVELVELRLIPPSLEDVFIALQEGAAIIGPLTEQEAAQEAPPLLEAPRA